MAKKIKRGVVKDIILIAAYFLAGLISLNSLNFLAFDILGIALLIAGVFGIVCLGKQGRFMFK